MILGMVNLDLSSITMIFEEIGRVILSVIPQVLISVIAIVIGYMFVRVVRSTIENLMKEHRLGSISLIR